MNIMLLAAGEGTRFRPHTEMLPKPAIPLCGIPLLYYSLSLIEDLHPQKIVINTYHLPKEIHRVGAELKQFGYNIIFSDEEDLLLGSGGGIAKAQAHLNNKDGFLVINADEVILPKKHGVMTEFVSFAQDNNSLANLMVMKHPEAGTKFNAVWVEEKSGQVIDFGKVKPQSNTEVIPYHFIGPMHLKNRIFDRLKIEPSNIIHDILKKSMKEGETVKIFPIECHWFETGNLNDYLIATKNILNLLLEQNPFAMKIKQLFLNDWTLEHSKESIILKHKTANLASGTDVKGLLILGPGCKINSETEVENIVCVRNICLSTSQIFKNNLII